MDRTGTPEAFVSETAAEFEVPRVESPQLKLAKVAAAGDMRATRDLLEQVTPRMSRSVQVILGYGSPDVEDVLQQSLIAFVQALPSFRGECEPVHFASRIAVRTAVATRKRSRVLKQRTDNDVDMETIASDGAQPAEQLRAARRKKLVLDLLNDIPDEQAESIALRFVLGWSLGDVAKSTGVPVNTVRSRLRLAKEALRRRIEQNPQLADELGVDA
jgi:RNA polymerase sigma-70 factor (ECF subfamily)